MIYKNKTESRSKNGTRTLLLRRRVEMKMDKFRGGHVTMRCLRISYKRRRRSDKIVCVTYVIYTV